MKTTGNAMFLGITGFIAASLPFGAKKLALLLFLFSVIAVGLSEPKIDTCQLPHKTGPCRAHELYYYYDSATGECKQFVYGGCRGNENKFEEIEDCQERCVNHQQGFNEQQQTAKPKIDLCQLPRKTGPCRGYNINYYYDSAAGECKKFNYGGCGGNANKFEEIEDCQERCVNQQELNEQWIGPFY